MVGTIHIMYCKIIDDVGAWHDSDKDRFVGLPLHTLKLGKEC